MVLSIFSVSGPIGLSSYQPQKAATELLLTAEQKSISSSGDYYGFRLNGNITPKYHHKLQKLQKQAAIRFNEQLIVRFNHQFRKFLDIKPAMLCLYSSVHVLKPQYEPLSA